MPRANPKSFCTKWVRMSNAMSDQEHAQADAEMRDAKQLAWFMNVNPAYAAYVAKQRDHAPLARYMNDTKPFSLFKS